MELRRKMRKCKNKKVEKRGRKEEWQDAMEGKKMSIFSLDVNDEREEEEWRSEVVKECEEEGTGEWATDDLTGKSFYGGGGSGSPDGGSRIHAENWGVRRSGVGRVLAKDGEGPDVDEVDRRGKDDGAGQDCEVEIGGP